MLFEDTTVTIDNLQLSYFIKQELSNSMIYITVKEKYSFLNIFFFHKEVAKLSFELELNPTATSIRNALANAAADYNLIRYGK